MFEDLETLLEIELLVHHTATIDLHTVVGEIFLGLRKKASRGGRVGQIEECENRKEHGTAAFDDEEVAPICERAGVDVEDAESEEPREGGCDGLRGIEDG